MMTLLIFFLLNWPDFLLWMNLLQAQIEIEKSAWACKQTQSEEKFSSIEQKHHDMIFIYLGISCSYCLRRIFDFFVVSHILLYCYTVFYFTFRQQIKLLVEFMWQIDCYIRHNFFLYSFYSMKWHPCDTDLDFDWHYFLDSWTPYLLNLWLHIINIFLKYSFCD